MTIETADVVVMGCGGFGAAAVYHLSRRGLRVIGIDRFTPPHDKGSSHGQTRVIRKAYFEHPDYVPLLHTAYDLWDQLEQESQQQLFVRCGLLLDGPKDGEVIRGTRAAMRQHQLSIHELTVAQAAERFPQFNFRADSDILFEPDAGYLWSDRCVLAHLNIARAAGARILTEEVVRSLDSSTRGVFVTTSRRTISAAVGVVTAGAWTSELLPEYMKWIQVRRKILCWYPFTDSAWRSSECPVHLFDLPDGQFYGFPSVDAATVKVAEHTGGQDVQSVDQLNRSVSDRDSSRVTGFVQNMLRGVSAPPADKSVCMYCLSPDGHFLLDRFEDNQLIVAAGFSGHGFKFTSVLGEAVADLVQLNHTHQPIEFLSAKRLQQP
jgi:sarcosine oxidase